jgi:hypothetical protein
MWSGYREFRVNAQARRPLIDFMQDALVAAGCRLIATADPRSAPFRMTFETADGERLGIIAYAFLITRTPTKNRPPDERSFQIKYGSKQGGGDHYLWQDPAGLYTTLFVGINPDEGFFVGADPEVHNPTKLFIRFEFKDEHAEAIRSAGWNVWERQKRTRGYEDPVEIVVGGVKDNFLRYIYFERAAKGLDQGHRQLLADRSDYFRPSIAQRDSFAEVPPPPHSLATEFEMSPTELLELIANARRLKMAVRGWVAEEHLRATLSRMPEITECRRLDAEGGPDLAIRLLDGPLLTIECKNVLRRVSARGFARVDFQRTRASKADPCSRYYTDNEFDVLCACLHAVRLQWEFAYIRPARLQPHPKCAGRLASNVLVDDRWSSTILPLLREASSERRRL